MRWSWKIGRIAGIDLRIHATFVILLVWLALAYYGQGGGMAAAARGVAFTLAIFASVVLHELGHALTARRYGVATRDITLLPIGGVASLEEIPEKPRQELAVALAGPAVTLAIAIVLYAVARVAGVPTTPPAGASPVRGAFLPQLLWVNVSLLLFNLLPAFPMDGGRVLRAALAMRMDYARATDVAARVGRGFALLFGVLGLLYSPMLVLIALFVWLGAAGEASAVQLRGALAGATVAQAMIRDVRVLAPDDPLDVALAHVLGGFQQDFPVVDDGRPVGVLTRAALLTGLAQLGRDAPAAAAMERTFETATPEEPLERAMGRLRACRCQTLLVLGDGVLRGVLTPENVAELVMIRSALDKRRDERPRVTPTLSRARRVGA